MGPSTAARKSSAWVFTVARNIERRRWRRFRIEREAFARSVSASIVPDEHVHLDLWRAVSNLPVRQREAIGARYVLGLTQAEVAVALGVLPGTAASTLAKARANLERALQDRAEPAND